MKVKEVSIDIPVPDLAEGKAWYEKVLDQPLDVEPTPGMALIQLLPTLSLMLTETDGPRDSDLRICFDIDDVPSERDRLVELGVEMGPIKEVPGIRFCNFSDPWDNRLCIVQLLD